jgi:photosystem II stability/assembly factor-like uncharacterized protein
MKSMAWKHISFLLILLSLSVSCSLIGDDFGSLQTATEIVPNLDSLTPTAATPTLSSSTGINSSSTVPFDGIRMFEGGRGWAWGYTSTFPSRIWRTDDGGLTWSEIMPGPLVWEFEYALDTETAWATVCRPPSEDCQPALARTFDSGSSWAVINETIWHTVSEYQFFNQKDGLLYGSGPAAGTAIWNFYESHDGGVSWTQFEFVSTHRGSASDIPGQYETCNMCGDALYLDFDRLVVVGGNLAQMATDVIPLWITFDRGQVWYSQELPLPQGPFEFGWFHPSPPIFVSDDFGILAIRLSTEDRERTAVAFYATDDGGLSWSFRSLVEIPGSVERWTRLEVVSIEDIFFRCGRDLCISHDGGWNWQQVSTQLNFETYSDSESYVYRFTFIDALTGWALVRLDETTTLWRTQDGGVSWQNLEPEFLP